MTGRGNDTFDVAVLGGGLAGSIVATILARKRFRVFLADRRGHPRFAIGESTSPQTSQLLSLLARGHDVPELHHLGLGSPQGLPSAAGASSGIKRTFGFAYHRLDHEHDPAEGLQFGNVWRAENHLFRRDVDHYLFELAGRYGATTAERTRVTAVDLAADAWTLTLNGDYAVRARFVVDAAGVGSVLAGARRLRERPTRLVHRSRCLFTHMAGVEPFERCVPSPLSVAWSHGTLHHVFDRGWIWVIPFGNWEGATNQLVSVGVTLDPERYPAEERVPPEEEFASLLGRLPSVERQFRDAKPVRPWVRTGRLQHSSSTAIGPRFCLLSHAAGFVDPLFSRGLVDTVEGISELVPRLAEALDEDDFAEERFEPVERVQRAGLDFADRLSHGSYLSWRAFSVWNAWMRVWAIGTGGAESNLGSAWQMGRASRFRKTPNPLFSPYEDPGYRDLFDAAYDLVRRYGDGELGEEEAAARLWAILDAYEFEMKLPDGSSGHEWALTSPACRDLYLGKPELHERWRRREGDPLPTDRMPTP